MSEIEKTIKDVEEEEEESIESRLKIESELEKAVWNIVKKESEHYQNLWSFFNALSEEGCISGMIDELVNYSDTMAFYDKYKLDINGLLKEALFQISSHSSPTEVFGDKWDDDDPLALDTINQNLLAWFGFEETCRIFAERLEYEF